MPSPCLPSVLSSSAARIASALDRNACSQQCQVSTWRLRLAATVLDGKGQAHVHKIYSSCLHAWYGTDLSDSLVSLTLLRKLSRPVKLSVLQSLPPAEEAVLLQQTHLDGGHSLQAVTPCLK